MTKRLQLTLVVMLVLLAPTLIFAGANKFGMAAAKVTANNTVVVPLEISNSVELAALDIPLRFSEGVTLKEVTFEGTRVDYFDFKVANINNEDRTVVIGLLPQFTPENKPELAVGEGAIANLVFEVNDQSATDITLEPIELSNPSHTLTFVHHGDEGEILLTSPEFTGTSVSLSNTVGIPETFALMQNYPNPFNPSTQISFALPNASNVNLSVYNVLGQKVMTLVDGQMEAGTHNFEFDGSSLSSGMYFYRILTDNFTETKKMVMLK
ncbi:MAG: T9SS C-terminal target domain-containing protein [Calditrichaeota bacterium]|nr:MAG: T9SS C-terminal target domain-containing protein [Calditrichota bacterium]